MSIYKIQRFPDTIDQSLKAWSAADEHIVQFLNENNANNILAINDRFGYVSIHCYQKHVDKLVILKSQQFAIQNNSIANNLNIDISTFFTPFATNDKKYKFITILIPKSLSLFQYYLEYAYHHIEDGGQIICAFMTKYFSKNMLEIGSRYFSVLSQSLAFKKSRLIHLSSKKTIIPTLNHITSIHFGSQIYRQYVGVFSASSIDYATQFLLSYHDPQVLYHKVLDIGCGNGIIAHQYALRYPKALVHAIDDSILAVESTRLNLPNAIVHWQYNLEQIKERAFDLIITNPPFHFEFENDISTALSFFKMAAFLLSEYGHFIVVANKHLNYKVHLLKYFLKVETVIENEKFVIYKCSNTY